MMRARRVLRAGASGGKPVQNYGRRGSDGRRAKFQKTPATPAPPRAELLGFVERGFQRRAGLEAGALGRGNLDFFAGRRIAAFAGGAFLDRKSAEADEANSASMAAAAAAFELSVSLATCSTSSNLFMAFPSPSLRAARRKNARPRIGVAQRWRVLVANRRKSKAYRPPKARNRWFSGGNGGSAAKCSYNLGDAARISRPKAKSPALGERGS
ncbi:MAG: hypothetical protein FD148_1276 [Methylocystaceae bacterium]|nr:MAG: hypothetical protein FD148_1276 [Methylocystaceae bacterium]